MTRHLILLSFLILAACGKPAEQASAAPAAAVTIAPAPTVKGPVIPASGTGIGPITADTAYDQAALAKLFPDARVEQGIDSWEGEEYGVLDVRGEGGLDLRITGEDGKVLSVWAHGGPVVGPRGERIGDGWRKGGFKPDDCRAGMENDSGKIICRRKGQPLLAYVYETQGVWEDGLSDISVPSATFLDRHAVLTGLAWSRR